MQENTTKNIAVYEGENAAAFLNRDITLIAEVEDGGHLTKIQTGHLDYKTFTERVFRMVEQH